MSATLCRYTEGDWGLGGAVAANRVGMKVSAE